MKNKLMLFGAVALIVATVVYAGRGKPNFNWTTADPFDGYAGQIQSDTSSDALLDEGSTSLLDDPVQ